MHQFVLIIQKKQVAKITQFSDFAIHGYSNQIQIFISCLMSQNYESYQTGMIHTGYSNSHIKNKPQYKNLEHEQKRTPLYFNYESSSSDYQADELNFKVHQISENQDNLSNQITTNHNTLKKLVEMIDHKSTPKSNEFLSFNKNVSKRRSTERSNKSKQSREMCQTKEDLIEIKYKLNQVMELVSNKIEKNKHCCPHSKIKRVSDLQDVKKLLFSFGQQQESKNRNSNEAAKLNDSTVMICIPKDAHQNKNTTEINGNKAYQPQKLNLNCPQIQEYIYLKSSFDRQNSPYKPQKTQIPQNTDSKQNNFLSMPLQHSFFVQNIFPLKLKNQFTISNHTYSPNISNQYNSTIKIKRNKPQEQSLQPLQISHNQLYSHKNYVNDYSANPQRTETTNAYQIQKINNIPKFTWKDQNNSCSIPNLNRYPIHINNNIKRNEFLSNRQISNASLIKRSIVSSRPFTTFDRSQSLPNRLQIYQAPFPVTLNIKVPQSHYKTVNPNQFANQFNQNMQSQSHYYAPYLDLKQDVCKIQSSKSSSKNKKKFSFNEYMRNNKKSMTAKNKHNIIPFELIKKQNQSKIGMLSLPKSVHKSSSTLQNPFNFFNVNDRKRQGKNSRDNKGNQMMMRNGLNKIVQMSEENNQNSLIKEMGYIESDESEIDYHSKLPHASKFSQNSRHKLKKRGIQLTNRGYMSQYFNKR